VDPLVTLTSAQLHRDGVGVPVWGPASLLRDLELRLGLPPAFTTEPARVRSYAARIEQARLPFLAASFAADRLGTAAAILALRDALVEAGWDGGPIPGGGGRLDAIAAVEALPGPPLPPGPPDRLAAVEQHLGVPPYDSLTVLPEERALWPARWLRVLQRAAGEWKVWAEAFPLAPQDTDLGRVQRGERAAIAGDGSLLLLSASTSLELAEAVAVEIAAAPGETMVVRSGDPAALDLALRAQGLPPLGDGSTTAAQPLLQILPLALELSFAPKDPRCAIDLLLLPGGPFDRYTGRRLAATLSQYPSVGGPRWIETRSALRSEDASAVAEWLEAPALSPSSASVEKVLARISMVQAFLAGSGHAAAAAALARAGELERALRLRPGGDISRPELRALLDAIEARAPCPHDIPWAGRAASVDDPSLVLRAHSQVIWWCFADRPGSAPAAPWSRAERRALAAARIHLPDPASASAARAEGFRRALRAAGRRLLLAVPDTIAGARTAPHPLWDEIRGRLGAGGAGEALITRHPAAPLRRPAVALPAPRPEWAARPEHLAARTRSPKSLQALLECPLKWTLEHQARLGRREIAAMPDRRSLEGFLAHRLIEELVRSEMLARGPDAVAAAAPGLLDRLVDDEAAHLRLPGMSFDLEALTRMLRRAADALARLVQRAGLSELRAEQPLGEMTWKDAPFTGRTDLTAVAPGGGPVVIDLKRRSANRLRETVAEGRAVQLAAYAFALRASSAYFSVTNATLVTTNSEAFGQAQANAGPGDQATWSRVETATGRIESLLAQGRIPVTGLEPSPEWPETVGPIGAGEDRSLVPSKRQIQRDTCEHCAFAAVCGRQWEELA
jgi:hypothetical protein